MQQMTCALRSYSITSSERAGSVGEISSCSALAVLRLSTNSILTDCWR